MWLLASVVECCVWEQASLHGSTLVLGWWEWVMRWWGCSMVERKTVARPRLWLVVWVTGGHTVHHRWHVHSPANAYHWLSSLLQLSTHLYALPVIGWCWEGSFGFGSWWCFLLCIFKIYLVKIYFIYSLLYMTWQPTSIIYNKFSPGYETMVCRSTSTSQSSVLCL